MDNKDSQPDSTDISPTDIAIVGMSLRVPGADTPAQFWENLKDGKESIVDIDDETLLRHGATEQDLADPLYVKRAPLLRQIEWFDAAFFGLNPNEASVMDPQHRLFLECGWHALEDAGYNPATFDGPIGVFGGSGYNAYMTYHLARNKELLDSMGFFLLRHTGNDKDFLTTRLSYCLNLTGPSVNVQTACSTSLVAIHLAVQSLINFECDLALAGGVTIELPHYQGYRYIPGEIYAPDGHCRAFDADSEGTVFGSGCGVVTLKRLADAIEDGDNIRAIVKGSAINNDGAGKAGYLAPSVDGQANAIVEALEFSGVDPESVTYIETHGTGTPVGDPIEVSALTAAYGANTTKKQYCGIGSVKSNIGHLDTAAGVASVIKAVLSMENAKMAPSLHFKKPNPEIDFASTPFFVNNTLRDWVPDNGIPRRAGVSSLGVGGTNAHIILEEAPAVEESGPSRESQLLLLSAKNEVSLQAAGDNLVEFVNAGEHKIPDLAYTLQVGRQSFAERRAIVCGSPEQLTERIDNEQHPLNLKGNAKQNPPPVTFMFTGQGPQYVGMTRVLYQAEPFYREEFDRCAQILLDQGGPDIRAMVFDQDPADPAAIEMINQTENTQPPLFTVEYCLAKLWMHWGIEPDIMIGHSMGEFAAACLAGVFTLEDALRLVTVRGQLMQSTEAGSMLAVPLSSVAVQKYLSDKIELAAINASSLCVISGDKEDILEIEQDLERNGTPGTLLKISTAGHSRTMEPILDAFEDAVRQANPKPPTRPFMSNLTGKQITSEQATNPAYWSEHLRNPVLFAASVSKLLEDPERVFLEVGPSGMLTKLVRQHEKFLPSNTVIETQGGPKSENTHLEDMLAALGKLWTLGVEPDWNVFYENETRRRVPAPGYSFNRQRYWVDRDGLDAGTTPPAAEREQDALLNLNAVHWGKLDVEPLATLPEQVLVIGHANAVVDKLHQALQETGAKVSLATLSDSFEQSSDGQFKLRVGYGDDYEKLAEYINQSETSLVIHAGMLGETSNSAADWEASVFVSPMLLFKSLAAAGEVSCVLLSDSAYVVTGDETPNALGAMTAGPAMVTGHELPNLSVAALDVQLLNQQTGISDLVSGISSVLAIRDHRPVVYATRQGEVYSKTFSPLEIESPDIGFQGEGAVVITGGLSGLGYAVAQRLVQNGCSKIALIGRTALPGKEKWQQWLDTHESDDPITRRMNMLDHLRGEGAQVEYFAADIAQASEVANCVQSITGSMGSVAGVFHCAGVLDDGPILTKDTDQAVRVLQPKVQGTLALADALAEQKLEFFVMFSSVSSLWGSAGQIDYASANAFQDAVIDQLKSALACRVYSLNWGAWRDTGMTDRLVNPAKEQKAQTAHPLIDRCLGEVNGVSVFATDMTGDKHWIIDQHRSAGTGNAILPGTGFIELVKAAYEPLASERHVQLTDVMFLSPFTLLGDESRELRVQFEPWSLGMNFSVISQADPEDRESWFTHMKGRIQSSKPEFETIDMSEIASRCGPSQPHKNEQDRFLRFGPRWDTIVGLQLGDGEALMELRLADEYASDVDTIWSHPGMLDVATAGVLKLVPGFDPAQHFYVPIAYSKLDFYGGMPSHWMSHVRYRAEDSVPGDVAVFDITIADPEGHVFAKFEEFMLKCVEDAETLIDSRPPLSARTNPVEISDEVQANELLQQRLEESGIGLQSGMDSLMAVINSNHDGQIALTNGDLLELLESITQAAATPSRRKASGQPAIDVSEVEELLNSHEAVELSAVVAQEDRFGEINVAAFVQLQPMVTATVSELRRFVRKSVDSQLVPSKFIEVDKIATDSEGKVDRSKLADPFGDDNDFIAPSTDSEKLLTRIWQDILGVDQISITDNFLDLGGHSLLGVRLLAAVRKETGIRLEDVVVVTYTLEQIAAELDKRGSDS